MGKSGQSDSGFTLKVEPTRFPNLLGKGLREKSQGGFQRFWPELMKEESSHHLKWGRLQREWAGRRKNYKSNFGFTELKNSLTSLSRNVEWRIA